MTDNILWAILGVMLGRGIGEFLKGFIRGIRNRRETQKVVKAFKDMNLQELDDIRKKVENDR